MITKNIALFGLLLLYFAPHATGMELLRNSLGNNSREIMQSLNNSLTTIEQEVREDYELYEKQNGRNATLNFAKKNVIEYLQSSAPQDRIEGIAWRRVYRKESNK